jgi:hypothetical protein
LPLDCKQQSRIGSFEGAVDEAHWLNRGPDGSELRLLKHRAVRHVTDHFSAAELAPFHEDEPLAPQQHYDIRFMRPEDVTGVCQCIYRTYGYSYVNPDVYFPDRFQHLHDTGELVSAVAMDEAGGVAGHCALERPGLEQIAEIGQAVVAPAHRGRRLFEEMRTLLMDQATKLDLAGVYGQAVATHTFSQRGERDFGARPVGLSLGYSPAMHFKGLAVAGADQRISCVLYFKGLSQSPPSVVYAPIHHRDMLGRIYRELGQDVTFGEPRPAEALGQLRVQYNKAMASGSIRVLQAGADTPGQLRQAQADLCDAAGADVLELDLALDKPESVWLCSAAEDAGFFFCGLGPGFAGGVDVLRLQYLKGELDASALDILEPLAQDIRDYAVAERARLAVKP